MPACPSIYMQPVLKCTRTLASAHTRHQTNMHVHTHARFNTYNIKHAYICIRALVGHGTLSRAWHARMKRALAWPAAVITNVSRGRLTSNILNPRTADLAPMPPLESSGRRSSALDLKLGPHLDTRARAEGQRNPPPHPLVAAS